MRKFDLEVIVGFFLLAGIISLGYISVKLGELEIVGKSRYTVYAEFEKVGGIKHGAVVEMAGVDIGKVKSIRLDDEYRALVEISLYKYIKLQTDAIASVKTKGLIGEKYIQITPGGSEKIISNGGKIRQTESAIDIEELLQKYVFGEV
ncbi:MAG: outer membrane lipid asymmetry maintenance protein MlaD [Thermodesulfovibrionales bacterium]|nr:outer membrane lipid asymmetry maintenance protein MlaD [Thermodesulfovibrionales bacterium]